MLDIAIAAVVLAVLLLFDEDIFPGSPLAFRVPGRQPKLALSAVRAAGR